MTIIVLKEINDPGGVKELSLRGKVDKNFTLKDE